MDNLQNAHEKPKSKINIKANTLVFDNEGRFAEFSGNVHAVEENSILTADKMKIFFRKEMKSADTGVVNDQSIKKILATGNVEIKFDNNHAMSERAEYSLIDNVLILTGNKTKVTNGKNYITGNKITINRTTGSVRVEGSGKDNNNERVEAEFFSGDKDSKKIESISFDKFGS